MSEQYFDAHIGSQRVERSHLNTSIQFQHLTNRIDGLKSKDTLLNPQLVIQDLEHLEWLIDNYYSYAHLTKFDYRLAIDQIIFSLNKGITKRDLAFQLKKFMAYFGDGHSRVSLRDVIQKEEAKWLPFEIIKHKDSFYAVNPNTKDFYNPYYPKIASISQIQIDKLYKSAEEMIPKTTEKYISSRAMNYLNYTGFILKTLNKNITDSIEVCFENEARQLNKYFSLGRPTLPPLRNTFLLKDSILDNNIGYLNLTEEMEDEDWFIEKLHKVMAKFKYTDGLIIDIRNNGGGSRAPLVALLPYFIDQTKVVNVCRYRINQKNDIYPKYGFFIRRYAYPENIERNSIHPEVKTHPLEGFNPAVQLFKKVFVEKIPVTNEKFSEMHYMTISPHKKNENYQYMRPVVLLTDSGCFSASDIFAAGLQVASNVTLIGETTGGGSGYAKRWQLPYSKIEVRLSRMFSYQPNGQLYDGHGVIPDIQLTYTLEDKMGKTDSFLTKAMEFIKSKNNQ